MAIGTVKLAGTERALQRVSIDPKAFGAGVAGALDSFANSINANDAEKFNLAQAQERQGTRVEDFKVQENFIRYQNEQGRVQEERIRGADRYATGLTNTTTEANNAANAAWLAEIPERLRPEYSVKLAKLNESQRNAAFVREYEAVNSAFTSDITDIVSDASTRISNGDISGPDALVEINSLIDKSDLPALRKEEMLDSVNEMLMAADYSQQYQALLLSQTPVREADGSDVVLGGALGWQRGLLNGIAKPESGGLYNIRYGGASGAQTFEGYADHPRIAVEISEGAEAGRKSTAAGRYQFTAGTWDFVVERAPASLNITDFSPANQDKAALWYAEYVYNSANPTGLSFAQMMQSGDRNNIRLVQETLGGSNGWAGLNVISTDAFANIVLGSRGIGGGGNVMPDAFTDERYASLSFTARRQLEADAAGATSRMQTALAAQEDQIREADLAALELAALRGELDAAQIEQVTKANGYTADERNGLMAQRDRFLDEGINSEGVVNRLIAGEVFSATDGDALNDFMRPSLDAIRSGDSDYLLGDFTNLVSRFGSVPSEAAEILAAQIRSPNAQVSTLAYQTLVAVDQADPQALRQSVRNGGLTQDTVDSVREYRLLSPSNTPEEMDRLRREFTDPNLQAQRTILATEADRFFVEKDINSLTKELAYVFRNDRTSGTDMEPAQQLLFTQEFQAFYREGYQKTRDQGDAWTWARDKMRDLWAPSPMQGTERLMRNGPQTYYPTVEGTHDWINDYALAEPAISGTILESEEIVLVADARTVGEGENYNPNGENNNASYMVMLYDTTTQTYRAVPNGAGGIYRMAFDPAEARTQVVENALVVNLEGKRVEIEQSLEEISEIEDDFRRAMDDPNWRFTKDSTVNGMNLEEIVQTRETIEEALVSNQEAQTELNSTRAQTLREERIAVLLERFSLAELRELPDQAIWRSGFFAPLLSEAISISEAQAASRGTK